MISILVAGAVGLAVTLLGTPVAIKLIHSHLTRDGDFYLPLHVRVDKARKAPGLKAFGLDKDASLVEQYFTYLGQLLGVLDNRNVRGPLVPLDDDEVAALRAGLAASDLI